MSAVEKLTLWFSSIAIIISIATFFLSLLSQNSNKRANKATLLHQVKVSIDDAKTQLENLGVKLAPLQAITRRNAEEERAFKALHIIYESSLEKVINAYEDGCQKYCADLIIREEFRKSYFTDIRNYVQNFKEKFTGPITPYTHILKLYNEWHKPN